jgi:geranylgeranyl diphosphate synthase type II
MKHFEEALKRIEKELATLSFPETPTNLYDPLRYFLGLGGKRVRPLLTLLGAELYGIQHDKVIKAALAVEVFHNFSLIHDDIMDEAPLRRKQPTVHEKWNPHIAILSGDVLLVKAYELLALQDAQHVPSLLKRFNTTATQVCEGQQLDMDFEKRETVTISEYLEMIRLKTSVLLGCALEMGAIVADASLEDRKHLFNFGQYLGVAFQIQDDILDLFADQALFGKQVGGDVLANKKTVLYLKAFELASDDQRLILKQLDLDTNPARKVKQTREIYEAINVKAACTFLMKEYYERAMDALSCVNQPSQPKEQLIQLADSLMNRKS